MLSVLAANLILMGDEHQVHRTMKTAHSFTRERFVRHLSYLLMKSGGEQT